LAFRGGGETYTMESKDTIQDRVRARDAAMRLLNRLTAGAAVSAVVGVGLLGAIGAYTIPGAANTSTASTSTSTASSSSSTSSSSGLQTSTTPVTSSSSSGVAVSGGS
jgi:cytoskeletal protein RodZ